MRFRCLCFATLCLPCHVCRLARHVVDCSVVLLVPYQANNYDQSCGTNVLSRITWTSRLGLALGQSDDHDSAQNSFGPLGRIIRFCNRRSYI